jgi:predicted nucleic acid-binding protein
LSLSVKALFLFAHALLCVAGAQYIVSRDAHLLNIKEFGDVRVLKPEVFLTALKRGSL